MTADTKRNVLERRRVLNESLNESLMSDRREVWKYVKKIKKENAYIPAMLASSNLVNIDIKRRRA